jgi:chromosomal replication initiation ATPase DnaA
LGKGYGKAWGIDLESIAKRISSLYNMEVDQLYAPGKYPKAVQARSVFCYWAVRELGVSATALAKKAQCYPTSY